MKRIKGIIWDMGGVFIRNLDPNPRRTLEKKYRLQHGSIDGLVFNSHASKLASVGVITVKEMWEKILTDIQIPLDEESLVKDLFWAGDGADDELLNFIRSLRPEFKTGLISNAWIDGREILTNKYRCMDAFDHAIFSAEIGIMKPDPKIYKALLREMKIKPEESIFIDDFSENVDGAKAIGMNAIQFLTKEQAINELSLMIYGKKK